MKITHNDDGSEKVAMTGRYGDQQMTVDRTYGAGGAEDASKRKYTVLMQGVNQSSAADLAEAYTGDPRFGNTARARGPQDVQMTFTQADIDRLRSQGQSSATAHDDLTLPGMLATAPNDPVGVGLTLINPHGNGWLAENLHTMEIELNDTMPGQLTMVDRSNRSSAPIRAGR